MTVLATVLLLFSIGASPDFLDWVQPDKDVFSIRVVS
jgi:hypothetical protein